MRLGCENRKEKVAGYRTVTGIQTFFKDRPVQTPSGFVVALHYHSFQIISKSFRDLPFNL